MDKAAREQTILKHLRFAHCSGFESMPGAMRHLHGDDAQQEAAIGLIQAVDRYDPARNNTFRNFARPRVRGAVKDYVRCATLVGRWRQDSPNSHCQVA